MTGSHRLVERALLASLAVLFAVMAGVAYGYPLRDRLGFGPGFFPLCLGVAGAVFSFALLVHSLRGRMIGEGGEALWPDRAGASRAAALFAGTVAAALVLEPLGFRLTALVFVAGLLAALGVRRPVPIAAFALVASFGLFHVFYYWLKVPLPVGAFGF